MIKKLRLRFTLYNAAIIGGIMLLLTLLTFHKSGFSVGKLSMVITFIILISIGSYIIAYLSTIPVLKAWRRQIDFTADASHELRTPLAVIRTNLELVLDSPNETVESQRRWLENIMDENERMSKLVDDLLTLSRSDSGQTMLNMSEFQLDDVIRGVVDRYIPLAARKNIKIKTELLSLSYYGDAGRIRQLVVILLDNAVNYIENGCEINICLDKTSIGIVFTVFDNGSGIPEKDIDNIFERFYRVEKSRNRNTEGTGLGLSVAKWIVEAHNGVISVQSDINKGTQFTVIL